MVVSILVIVSAHPYHFPSQVGTNIQSNWEQERRSATHRRWGWQKMGSGGEKQRAYIIDTNVATTCYFHRQATNELGWAGKNLLSFRAMISPINHWWRKRHGNWRAASQLYRTNLNIMRVSCPLAGNNDYSDQRVSGDKYSRN